MPQPSWPALVIVRPSFAASWRSPYARGCGTEAPAALTGAGLVPLPCPPASVGLLGFVALAFDVVGAAGDGVSAAVDGVGAAVDGVGAAVDGVSAAVDGVGAAIDGVGAAVDGVGAGLDVNV